MDNRFNEIIKKHFENFKKITKTSLNKFFKENENIESYVISLIDEYFVSKFEVVSSIVFDKYLKKCKTCGKIMSFKQSMNNECCSVVCAAINENRNEKIRNTNAKRYGAENVFASPIIKEKIKSTLIKKYGVDNAQKNKSIHQKTIKTIKEKYSVNNSFNCKNVDKAWKMFDSWKDYVVPMFTKDEYINPQGKTFRWKCAKCGNEFEQALYSTNHLKDICQEIPRCWKCFPRNSQISNKEKELRKFCEQFFDDIRFNDKKLLNGTELDVVIPTIKLALEFNGCYWHSTKNGHGNNYHLNKTKLCNEVSYRLIHVWEDEWDSNKDDVKKHLEDVFLGREDLNFIDEEIKLDRSWYNNIEIPGYILKEEIAPEIEVRLDNEIENCGFLKYFKKV